MATLDVKTIGGSPNKTGATAIVDANYDSWLAVRVDSTQTASPQVSPVPYALTGTTAGEDEVYGVLGSKASSIESRAEDTIIRGGVTPVQFASTYAAATHLGLRVTSSATAGVVAHTSTAGVGRGRIINGGTMNIKGSTVNVVIVDWDAN